MDTEQARHELNTQVNCNDEDNYILVKVCEFLLSEIGRLECLIESQEQAIYRLNNPNP